MTGIAMAMFMTGGDGSVFNGLPATVQGRSETVAEPATVTLTVASDGTWSINGNVIANSGTWLTGGTPSNYDVYVSSSVSPTTGTTNTWLNLGTTQVWTKVQSTNGSSSNQASNALQIRMASSPFTVLDSATIDWYVGRTG